MSLADSLAIGLGYQESTDATNDASATGVSLTFSGDSGISAGIVYTDFDNHSYDSHLGLGVGYSSGPLSLHINYGEFDGGSDPSGFGLAAGYDLGGGATVLFGYGSSDSGGSTTDSFSFGLSMSF